MSPFVEVQNLGKYFGDPRSGIIKAVDDVSFSVSQGEVLGFLGPNGAGKSTTMKMISCFLAPDFGTARVRGHDILKDPTAVRTNLGYLPETAPAYEDMTVAGFLKFVSEVRGLSEPRFQERLDRVVGEVHLEKVLGQTIGTLSKGFKRRVGLAQAILHDPDVLILDEPTDGLDPNQKFDIRKLIKSMSPGKAIVLSTHILEEVDELCTRVIIIAGGKVVANETPETLRAKGRLADVFRSLTVKEGVPA